MKKFLTIALVAVFFLTVSAVTYGAELKASGYIRNRTALYKNADEDRIFGLDSGFDDTNSWIDYRFRLKFDLIASEDLGGVVYFEGDDDWGGTSEGDFGADGANVEIKNAYLWFNVPGLEDYATKVTAGIHSFFLGGEFGVDDDASGVTVDFKLGEAAIRVAMFKEVEGTDFNADDATHYGARVRIPMGDFTPWGWFNYANYHKGSAGTLLGISTNSSSDLYWVGVGLDGKIGNVGFKSEFAYSGGTLDYPSPVIGPLGTVIDEEEIGGWVIWAKAGLPVEWPLTLSEVGLEVMWTSTLDGQDFLQDGDWDTYLLHPAAPSYRPMVAYSGTGINDSVGLNDGDVGGDWLVMAYADFKPLDWLSVTGYVGYIGDNVDDGDRYGTATNAAGALEDEDGVGIEIGAMATCKIMKGLDYRVGVGYIFAGDALDQTTGVAGVNDSPDDPWAIVSQIRYKF
jgi:hypothetical protein